jgi:MoaA/NifB/PqqE/SkfB family radical SAM enzyme
VIQPHVSVGFALTQHCNLRCAHCIRDDVTEFRELDVDTVLRILREARDHLGSVRAGFTGGEPMLHQQWPRLIEGLRELGIPYTFVSNGWHMRRFVPLMDRHPPSEVRLSLSGADQRTHDEERGRDSFRRVLLATAILTSRQVRVSYAIIVDRRTRHQLAEAVELTRSMGVPQIRFTLPQPVPASAERDTDLPPAQWHEVRRELDELASMTPPAVAGGTDVVVDYGAPFNGPSFLCSSMTLQRLYVDVHGRMSTCCQLSDYGAVASDVVGDATDTPFAVVYDEHVRRIDELKRLSAPRGSNDPLADFPCLRCARATGKMEWIRHFPESPWHIAADGADPAASVPVLVPVTYSRRARRVVSTVVGAST